MPSRVLKKSFSAEKTCKNPYVFEGRFSKTALCNSLLVRYLESEKGVPATFSRDGTDMQESEFRQSFPVSNRKQLKATSRLNWAGCKPTWIRIAEPPGVYGKKPVYRR